MSRTPGAFLLKVARVLFDESVVAEVVLPTIADLQHELRTASGPRAWLGAALGGYAAFWLLALAAPVAFHRWPTRRIGENGLPDRSPGIAFALVVATMVLGGWSFLSWWMIVTGAGGVVCAMLLHRWHEAHPAELALPQKPWVIPEINQSRIRVDGNIGGLSYVVGSLAVALVGLPAVRWFFVAAATLGLLCAWALVAWRNTHPARRTSILLSH